MIWYACKSPKMADANSRAAERMSSYLDSSLMDLRIFWALFNAATMRIGSASTVKLRVSFPYLTRIESCTLFNDSVYFLPNMSIPPYTEMGWVISGPARVL